MNLIACMLQKRYFWFLLSHRFFLCWAFRWYMLYRNFWAASGMRSFCTISRFCAAESAATGPPSSARCTAIAHRTMRADTGDLLLLGLLFFLFREDADEEPEIYRPIPMEHTHGGED